DASFMKVLRTKWWKYLVMGLADVEANYTLLDCFVIPVLMVLSWIFLKTRYRPVTSRIISCLITFLTASCSLRAASDVVLGDGLVLLSSVLYAVSNLCQEHTVKNLSRVEFLGMMGLFGTLISGVQL
ncbi:hypothetical protein XENOCAPTIV_015143, partial [Xenoophorus captivus]